MPRKRKQEETTFQPVEKPSWAHNVPGQWFRRIFPLENGLMFDGYLFWPDNAFTPREGTLYHLNGIEAKLTDMEDLDESRWTLPTFGI